MTSVSESTGPRARAQAARLGLPHMGFVLGRERLRELVGPVRGGGLVSVVAGPGCGKTSFIVDLLSSGSGRLAYLALDESDRDPLRFLQYLATAIGTDLPQAPEAPVLDGPELGGLEGRVLQGVAQVVEYMGRHAGEDTLLAIDDLHSVEASQQTVLAIGLLVRALPPGWTVILASRRPLPFKLDAVDLGGRLVRITGRSLRLTPGELVAWAAQNWKVTLSPSEARALWRLTQGWPAALVLLGQRMRARRRPPEHGDLVAFTSETGDLREYLERDILAGLGDTARRVISIAGLLPRVMFPRDAGLFAAGLEDAEGVLEDLVAKGFLVTRSGPRTYQVHPLARRYAEREATRDDESRTAAKGVARHLEKVGEYYHAARLYARAGLAADASRPLRSLALMSLNAAAGITRERWSSLLPGQEAEGTVHDPWLAVAKARALQQRARYEGASALYQRAARLLSASGDKEGLLHVLLASAFCLQMQGRREESLAVLTRCNSLAGTPREKAEVLVAEGHVLVSLCRWDEGVEVWERALALAPEARRSELLQRVEVGRARLFCALGHYPLARQWVEKALGDRVGAMTPARVMGIQGAALIACLSGDYESADRLVAECQRVMSVYGFTFMEAPHLLSLADVCVGRGEYRAAISHCKEARRFAEQTGATEGLLCVEQLLGDICRCNRNPQRALEHHRAALGLVEKEHLTVLEQTRAQVSVGMDLAVMGEAAAAQKTLEETVRISRHWGLKASLSPSLLYLGWLHSREGREREAASCLAEALRIAEEHEHVHFLNQEARVAVPIFALCDRFGVASFLKKKIIPMLSARLQEDFQDLAAGEIYPTDVALGVSLCGGVKGSSARVLDGVRKSGIDPAGGQDVVALITSLTEREREILTAIAGGMPNKVIGARLFISEKTVKTHANHIFRKLGVSNRLQATLVFQSHQRALAAGTAGRNRRW